jgi:hypothetical protein
MPENPSSPSLNEARIKLDAVTLQIERRQLQYLLKNKRETLQSAHVYTDASPVTGNELQGMLLELCFVCGLIQTIVLPGVMMHYGACAVVDKCVALLWALFLVVGPEFELLNFLVSMITSTTTDMGTELGVGDCPDILHTLLRRITGVPMAMLEGTTDGRSRLLKHSLKIAGWYHHFENLTEYDCNQIDRWPLILNCIRCLCKFFRNKGWMQALVVSLKSAFPDVVELLKSFKASLKNDGMKRFMLALRL